MEKTRLNTIDWLNYFCIDFFESRGVTPKQSILDACEIQIQNLLQQQLKKQKRKSSDKRNSLLNGNF